MKWRLREGQGEAIYEIGVGDDGFLHGLTCYEMNASLETLATMAKRLGASVTVLRRRCNIFPMNCFYLIITFTSTKNYQ